MSSQFCSYHSLHIGNNICRPFLVLLSDLYSYSTVLSVVWTGGVLTLLSVPYWDRWSQFFFVYTPRCHWKFGTIVLLVTGRVLSVTDIFDKPVLVCDVDGHPTFRVVQRTSSSLEYGSSQDPLVLRTRNPDHPLITRAGPFHLWNLETFFVDWL